jgi:DNA-directed RNA polymerase II subunit RPB1
LEIVTEIENFLDNYDNRIIIGYKKNNKLIHNDNRQIKYLLEIALYSYLAPNKCIFKYNLTKKLFKNIMTHVNSSFIKALVEPGEVVGIISGNTLGEATTQMTMNTKHTAGTKSFQNMGVDRIQELLHYSKNIKFPIMQIYFEDAYSTDDNLMSKIVSNFKFLSLRELINSSEIYYDNKTDNNYDTLLKKDNVSNPFFINNQKIDLSLLPVVFRFKLNIEKMLIKEITLLDIKTKFITYWHSNYNSIKNLKKTEKDIITKINRCAILSNKIDEEEQIIHIRFNISMFNHDILLEFLRMVLDDIKLKGINDIKEVLLDKQANMLTYDNNTGDKIKKDKYTVSTIGINMELLRTIKGIDMTKTRCNDIETIFKLYGIEAARQILIYELMTTYQGTSIHINHTHYSLVVDQMTYMGEVIAIDRHGLSKLDIDPLSRASFEKTISHFINASLFNEKDNMTSISSRIMMGKVIKGGTGMFDILLDTKKIENSEYIDEPIGRVSFPPLKIEPLINDILKNNDIHINFYIPDNI